MTGFDIDPERTVYWVPGTRQNGEGGPIMHINRDCGYLRDSETVRKTQRQVLYPDSRVCELCQYDSPEFPEVTSRPGGVGPDPSITNQHDDE